MKLLQIPLLDNPDAAQKASQWKENAAQFKSLSAEDLINNLAHTIVDFAIHLAIAIFVFYVGKFLIRRIYNFVTAVMTRRQVDKSLSTFILSLVRMLLYFILIVTVIGILGINTSSFIALFASAGVALGMALSGTLQNFAGGVLILLLKPYKIGDYIEAQGYEGTVDEIQIFSTIITTADNKSIIIPNGPLSTSSINNWSREKYRRIEWIVGISYGDSVDTARTTILSLLADDPRIVKTTLADDMSLRHSESSDNEPTIINAPESTIEQEAKRTLWDRLLHRHKTIIAKTQLNKPIDYTPEAIAKPKLNADRTPKVFVHKLDDSSVNLSVRAWVTASEYWSVYFDMNELFYTTLPQAGITFPFPQRDVHVVSNN